MAAETQTETPAETVEPRVLKGDKPRRKLSVTVKELTICAAVVLAIVGVALFVVNKSKVNHDIAAAQIPSDKVIADIQNRDGAAVYKLGDAQFQSSFTAAQLTTQFKNIEVATLKAPSLKEHAVINSKSGRSVLFIYEYDALKVPYYIRTTLHKQGGSWRLSNITGSADASKL